MMNMFRDLFKPSLQLSDLDVSENKRIIKEALRSLNCTGDWQKDGNDIIVRFDFQSGHFGLFISAQHPQIELSFLYFGEAKMEEINLIRHVCFWFYQFCVSLHLEPKECSSGLENPVPNIDNVSLLDIELCPACAESCRYTEVYLGITSVVCT